MRVSVPLRSKEPELFPIAKPEPIVSDWVDENEQLHWVLFMMGFFVGSAMTAGLILL